jgi:hypothetical protein
MPAWSYTVGVAVLIVFAIARNLPVISGLRG